MCSVFFFLQSLVREGWQLLVLQVLAGVALGGIVPGISALLAQFTHRGEEGAVYGLDNAIVSGARALGPMLGVGIGMWLGLRAVFTAAGVLYLLAGVLAAWRLPAPAARPTAEAHAVGGAGHKGSGLAEKTVPIP